VQEVFLIAFLLLDVVNLLFDLLLVHATCVVDLGAYLFLEVPIHLLAHRLFFLLLSLTFCSLSRYLHVSLAGLHYVSRALLRLVELLPCLKSEMNVNNEKKRYYHLPSTLLI
jgi:hypothetical protein